MDAKNAKALDRAALSLKRKRLAIRDWPSFTSPTRRAVKHMRLGGHERKPTNSGPGISQPLVTYYLNYKKSGTLERLLFYKNGEWLDYPKDVLDLVKKDFEIKKAAVEVELNGQDLVLDFLHMYQVDLKMGLQQPIAWIDEAGCCFFPEVYAAAEQFYNFCEHEGGEGHDAYESNEINLHLAVEIINGADESKSRECSEDYNALVKDVELEGSTNKTNSGNVGEAIKKNEDIDSDAYPESGKLDLDSVKKTFLTGMSDLGITDSDIVETYCCSGMSMQARLELFQKQAEITKGIKGDANVRYAWLASSKGEVSTMVEYGLGHCALSASKRIYGFGVHLAALTFPNTCAPDCDVDEKGVRHLVLCRVIMGNMELLRPDSGQSRPSGCEYSNGVDDIQNPRFYVVWNMNVNTHIYPEFVVSFKVPLDVEGHFCSTGSKKKVSGDNTGSHGSRYSSVVVSGKAANVVPCPRRMPTSPWLPFPILFAAIRNKVPPKVMELIKAYYGKFRARQISREDFVMKLRLLVGDTLLRATIAVLQFKVPSNGELGGPNRKQG